MFLELEQADPGAHMHIGALMVFEPTARGGAPTLDAVRRHLDARLGLLPRYRQRLSTPRTGGLSWPTWEPVEGFRIARHVRRERLPAPGGEREVTEWCAAYWSERLDRSRPLWDAVLLDGLEDGRWALATKTHHCLVDGIGSVDVGYLMLDAQPEAAPPPPPPPAPADADDEAAGNGHRWPVPGLLAKGARAGLGAVRHPLDTLGRAKAMADVLVRDELIAAPHSSLNGPIGTERRFATVRVPLDDVKGIRRELGGTVNDVVLALCTGGLRQVLLARGEALPASGLRAQIPVNIRTDAERMALGNRLTSLFVPLPVGEEGPLGRYRRVVEHAETLKHGDQALGSRTLVDLTSLAPPVLHTVLAQSLFDVRLFNVTITNVPGPQQTLYAFGAPMAEVLPLVPLFARHAVGIAVVSYDGTMVFGLNADRDGMPDVDTLADGIRAEFADLRRLAGLPAPA